MAWYCTIYVHQFIRIQLCCSSTDWNGSSLNSIMSINKNLDYILLQVPQKALVLQPERVLEYT